MSILNSMTRMVLSAGNQKTGLAGLVMQNPKLMQAVAELISTDNQIGGLDGLLGQFQREGLGELVQSWTGSGSNKEISPAQIERALGTEVVSHLAERANMTRAEVADVLAKVLPEMISNLTRKGSTQVPGNSADVGRMLHGVAKHSA